MHPVLILQLLILLAVANGAPVLAKRIFETKFSYPLDAGKIFLDGRHLFGKSKTIRGILSSVILTTCASLLIGMGWKIGVLVASVSMIGDLFSSFAKRRLNLPPSSRATGLDQIPESLLPLLACQKLLPISYLDIAAIVLLFFIGEIVLSRVLYRLHIRDHPY